MYNIVLRTHCQRLGHPCSANSSLEMYPYIVYNYSYTKSPTLQLLCIQYMPLMVICLLKSLYTLVIETHSPNTSLSLIQHNKLGNM